MVELSPVIEPAPAVWCVDAAGEKSVSDVVQRVLRAAQPVWNQPERRRRTRHPFPRLMSLTPLADHALAQAANPLVVVGKNLGLRGLDFYHCQPLPYRRVIVSFDDMPGPVHLVLLISWCRFLRPGWYDSGGRFIQVVSPAPDTSLY